MPGGPEQHQGLEGLEPEGLDVLGVGSAPRASTRAGATARTQGWSSDHEGLGVGHVAVEHAALQAPGDDRDLAEGVADQVHVGVGPLVVETVGAVAGSVSATGR